MNLPRGELVRSRVVDDPGEPLTLALDRGLDGYAVLEGALPLDDAATGVLTFADGVPTLAYERHDGAGGRAALATLAGPGPFRVEVYALAADDVAAVHDRDDGSLVVTPGAPAERLADDPDLAARTRERAPAERLDASESPDAVTDFLDDEARIEAIRERARDEARARAAEWGLTDQLADPPPAGPEGEP